MARLPYITIISGLLLASAADIGAQGFKFAGRAQLMASYDDNISEDYTSTMAAEGLRVYSNFSVTRRFLDRWFYSGGLEGGNQVFIDRFKRSRFHNQVTSSLSYQFTEQLTGTGFGRLESRGYVKDDRDYVKGSGKLMARYRFTPSLSGTASYQRSGSFYFDMDEFNHIASYYSIGLRKTFSRHWMTGVSVTRGYRIFDNLKANVFDLEIEDVHRDRFITFSPYFEFVLKSFLISADYAYTKNTSNSFALSYTSHQISMVVSKKLASRLFLNGYVTLQKKHYYSDEEAQNYLGAEFGIDDESKTDDNSVVLELTRKVTGSTSLKAQFRLSRNESIVKDEYYSKKVFSLGIEKAFE